MEPRQSIDNGEQLGHFVIERLLGRGGEGSVFLARDVVLHRLVALKLVHAKEGLDSRTLEEARLIATLDHPNIIRVYHVGQGHNGWYMAMEYLAGGSLAQRLVNGRPLELNDAIRVGVAAADALRHAHEIGVLHRDVKPQNLLISKAGTIKLADFGLAAKKATSASKGGGHQPMVGTPHYTAPEVWLEQGATSASDVYALGACLAHLVTGEVPFAERTMEGLRDAHLRREAAFGPHVPEDVRAVLVRCLAKDPKDRPESAAALYRELKDLLKHRLRDSSPKITSAATEPRAEAAAQALPHGESPAVRVAREWLEELIARPRALPLLHGEQAYLHRHLFELALDAGASNLQRLLTLRIDPGGDAPVEAVMARMNQPLSPRLTRGTRAARALGVHVHGERAHGFVFVELRRTLSSAELADLAALADLASARHVSFVLLGDERTASALALLGKNTGLMPEPLPTASREGTITALHVASAAGAEPARWTADAEALAFHFASMRPDGADRLAWNAGVIRRLIGLPLLTSFCVLGANAHTMFVKTIEELEPRFRSPPEVWPDPELLVFLSTLRETEGPALSDNVDSATGGDR